ncbi:MAG: response regulator transcription factor [Betaproteobacteria bacterium]|nr:response regulator transcription factor [Betaproteobacteria bacterium]
MTSARPTAVIADDEPALLAELKRLLEQCWPALEILAEASNGTQALEAILALRPDVAFLDIHMPGITGLDAAQRIGGATHVVFVTAYDEFAIRAFEQGAVDYVLKPAEPARLAKTVERLQSRLGQAPADLGDLVRQLMTREAPKREHLQWLQVLDRDEIRFLSVADVNLFQAADKYTLVRTAEREWLIRTSLKDLESELDPREFWRIHRNTIARVGAIEKASRDLAGRLSLRIRGVPDAVAVSRAYAHLFRQM